jgi:hypothetical protein
MFSARGDCSGFRRLLYRSRTGPTGIACSICPVNFSEQLDAPIGFFPIRICAAVVGKLSPA